MVVRLSGHRARLTYRCQAESRGCPSKQSCSPADFGAEVIKVEPPEGDPVRAVGERVDGKSLYAASILRNKRLVALELRNADGQQRVRELAAKCDVLDRKLSAWHAGEGGVELRGPHRGQPRPADSTHPGPVTDSWVMPSAACFTSTAIRIERQCARPCPAHRHDGRPLRSLRHVMATLSRGQTGKGQCIDVACTKVRSAWWSHTWLRTRCWARSPCARAGACRAAHPTAFMRCKTATSP